MLRQAVLRIRTLARVAVTASVAAAPAVAAGAMARNLGPTLPPTQGSLGSACSRFCALYHGGGGSSSSGGGGGEEVIGVNELRPRMLLVHQDKLMKIIKIDGQWSGRGSAFVHVELRQIGSSKSSFVKFSSSASVVTARLENAAATVAYREADATSFMDSETYEIFSIADSELPESKVMFLDIEGLEVVLRRFRSEVVDVGLPEFLEVEVDSTGAELERKSAGYKDVYLKNGLRVANAPMFIQAGDRIRVRIREDDGRVEYVERTSKST